MRKAILFIITFLFVFTVSQNMIVEGADSGSTRVEIKEVEPFVFCSIRHKGPFSEIEQVINNLIATMQSQNVHPQGPMFGIYHTVPGPSDPEGKQMEWEIGFPITEQTLVQAPLERNIWNHTIVATAIYTGPYEETGEAITDMFEWMETNGYEKVGPVLEKYLETGTPDAQPSKQKTEIWIPCEKK